MSNVDINVDRWTDGLTDGQKIGRLYRTLLQAGAIKMKILECHLLQILLGALRVKQPF